MTLAERARGLARADRDVIGPDERPELDVLEAAALLGALGLVGLGTVSLALAQLDRFTTTAAVAGGAVAVAALLALVLLIGGRPRFRIDAFGLVGLVLAVVACAVMFLPGFPYAFADKDPGIYVTHAFGIEDTGAIDIPDEVATIANEDPGATIGEHGTGGRYPGFRVEEIGDTVTTSTDFFHFTPATFAVAVGLGGTAAVFNIAPLVATLAVIAIVAAARRTFGSLAAAVTLALLVTNMMEVWQAKTPSTEILMQAIVSAGLLAVVLAITTRWAGAGFVAGVMVGASFLVRPDGFLVVGLAAGLCAVVLARGRADRRLWAGLAGALTTLPYAAYNAYVVEESYVTVNNVPSWPIVFGLCAIAVVAGASIGAVRRSGRTDAVESRIVERVDLRWVGGAVVVLYGIGAVVAWNRETWFGATMGSFAGEPIPTYDERNLEWLSYFVTVPGLVFVLAGMAVVLVRRRWEWTAIVLLAPGLALLPIYIYRAQISPRLMWWVRRFVPVVVPAVLITLAVAIVWLLTRKNRAVATVGGLVLLGLVGTYLSQSLPLRDHREFAGSYDAAELLADTTEGAGIVLVDPGGSIVGSTRNLPAVAWLVHDTPSTYLPPVEVDREAFVEGWVTAVDGPLYVFSENPTDLPEGLDPQDWEQVRSTTRFSSLWNERVDRRPDEPKALAWPFGVWRYAPSG